jgi:integrase
MSTYLALKTDGEMAIVVNEELTAVPLEAAVMPDEFDEDLLARLAELDEASAKYVADKKPKNTKKAYESDWRVWQGFCLQLQIPFTAITVGTLTAFVEWLWTQPGYKPGMFTSPNTIDRRLAGVVVTGRDRYGLKLDQDIALRARELLKRLKEEMEEKGERRGVGKAPALLIPHLKKIVEAQPENLYGWRNRSLVLLQFAVAGREAEMANLRLRDVRVEENGLVVTVRVSKTSTREVAVPYGQRPSTCPVRSFLVYVEAAGLDDPDDFLFKALHWRTLKPLAGGLHPKSVGALITKCSEDAKCGVRHTGHSPRRGVITEAARKGIDRKTIARQSGHRPGSPTLEEYIEEGDRWEDNALIGIGL